MSGHAFTRSIQAPRSGSCCLYAGRRLGSKRAPPRLIPGRRSNPGFDVIFRLSTRQRQRTCVHRSSSRPIPDAIEPRLFPPRSAQRSSANAPVGGLKPPPDGRLRRAIQPPSLLQHRMSMAIEFSPTAATNFPTGGHVFSPLVATNLPTNRDERFGSGQGLDPLAGGRLREPVAVLAVGDQDVGVMQ